MKVFTGIFAKGALVSLLALTSLGCGMFGGGSSNVRLIVTGLPAVLKQKAMAQQLATGGSGPLLAAAPVPVQSIALTVSGPGMDTLAYYYKTIPDSISLEVPAGKAREFMLYVYTGPENPTAVINYLGTAITDLEPDETVNLILRMLANETKLVVPDYLGDRLVIMDNMHGDGWVEKTAAEFGLASYYFNPYDIDFDAEGYMCM
jgi:hypothetical protein